MMTFGSCTPHHSCPHHQAALPYHFTLCPSQCNQRICCLGCSQASGKLRCWGMVNGPPTYYDLIARDKEVVKSVLLLTGSVETVKQQVAEYLAKFDKYSFLWTQDLQVQLAAGHRVAGTKSLTTCASSALSPQSVWTEQRHDTHCVRVVCCNVMSVVCRHTVCV